MFVYVQRVFIIYIKKNMFFDARPGFPTLRTFRRVVPPSQSGPMMSGSVTVRYNRSTTKAPASEDATVCGNNV